MENRYKGSRYFSEKPQNWYISSGKRVKYNRRKWMSEKSEAYHYFKDRNAFFSMFVFLLGNTQNSLIYLWRFKEAESTFAPNIFVIHDTIIMRAS